MIMKGGQTVYKDILKNIDDWCNSITHCATDGEFSSHKSRVTKSCPRGRVYFCDGRVNVSCKKSVGLKPINLCEWFKNHKCTYMDINSVIN